MKRGSVWHVSAFMLCAISLVAPANAAEFDVTVTNLTHGIYFTPLLITAHEESAHLFQPGVAATSSLQLTAECGDISSLLADLGGADDDTIENPAGGLLAPGAETSATLDTGDSGNEYLSIVGMMLPTNDGFVGLDSLPIPSTAGIYEYTLNGYDAGTEANNELLDTSGCAAGMAGIPGDPTGLAGIDGEGVASSDANTHVHVHRGSLGDTNPTGGASDLDSTVHRWLNPVARLVIQVR